MMIFVLGEKQKMKIEVILCRDCRFFEEDRTVGDDGMPMWGCPFEEGWNEEDDYCSYAEEKY